MIEFFILKLGMSTAMISFSLAMIYVWLNEVSFKYFDLEDLLATGFVWGFIITFISLTYALWQM